MKTLMIRAFVVALAVTGISATAMAKTTSTHKIAAVASTGFVPVCPPSSPTGCGMDSK